MSWRIHDSVVRGVLDFRVPGVVSGKLWLAGRAAPVVVALKGNAERDLAGCELTFEHRRPEALRPSSLSMVQEGVVGVMTASRKARVFVDSGETREPDAEELGEAVRPTRLANVLFLEWFSERNGPVVLESADHDLHLSEHVWTVSAADAPGMRYANELAAREFLRRWTGSE